jgi:hypothetical protein
MSFKKKEAPIEEIGLDSTAIHALAHPDGFPSHPGYLTLTYYPFGDSSCSTAPTYETWLTDTCISASVKVTEAVKTTFSFTCGE